MHMIRILFVLLSCLLCGGVLASGMLHVLPLRPGVLGLLAMLAVAWMVRRRWSVAGEAAPGTPERALWLKLGSIALVLGNLVTGLWRIGPAMRLHTPLVNAWAIDVWTLIIGACVAWVIARDPDPRRDERDTQIAITGARTFNWTLLAQLLLLTLLLGYDPGHFIRGFSQVMLAHLLIVAVTIGSLADAMARLHAYWREHRAERLES